MSSQALNAQRVQGGIEDVLLGSVQLYELLRKRYRDDRASNSAVFGLSHTARLFLLRVPISDRVKSSDGRDVQRCAERPLRRGCFAFVKRPAIKSLFRQPLI